MFEIEDDIISSVDYFLQIFPKIKSIFFLQLITPVFLRIPKKIFKITEIHAYPKICNPNLKCGSSCKISIW